MTEQMIAPVLSEADLTHNFKTWAERNKIEPREFARKAGYSENHAYMLLRGDTPFTWLALGRFVRGYGINAAREIVEGSGKSSQAIAGDEATIA